MTPTRLACGIGTIITLIVVATSALNAQSPTYSVLSEFNGTNRAYPYANLISDAAGNLYGLTNGGGLINESQCFTDTAAESNSCGTVFKLSKNSSGAWTRTVLHEFTGNSDGANPLGTLVLDSAGNLYGTTYLGGVNRGGVAFELSPSSSGGWREAVLHSFPEGSSDGSGAAGGLVFDSAGNLYGTLVNGGNQCTNNPAFCGMVYELSPGASGWTETIIYYFADLSDGMTPFGALTIDNHGNLFGTTQWGGNLEGNCNNFPYYQGCGTVFELTPNSSRTWSKTSLHNFADGGDGAFPLSGLTLGSDGNLYGDTELGGDVTDCTQTYIPGCGVVFRLSPNASGGWTLTTLHVFAFGGSGGASPTASVTLDPLGNVYGTTSIGGLEGVGVVFKLSPNSSGGWKETVLHPFTTSTGANPYSGLTFNTAGDLFGMTEAGGPSGCNGSCGVVFEVKP
jgi:uncharacterized repeat protein (TIGR03803 family)